MGRIARIYSRTGIYHIIFRGMNKQDIFLENSDYRKMTDTILNVKKDMDFEIYAYCFMSNHVHLVIKEKLERDISLIMKRILTKYVGWFNYKYGRTGALIENRYKSKPVEVDEYFMQLIKYVHRNPLKAGLVKEIGEYQYSSYNEYLGNEGIADTDFVLDMLEGNDFIELHNEEDVLEFTATGRKRKTDNEVKWDLLNRFGIANPVEIVNREDKNDIISELKTYCSARQIERITGISRKKI